MTTVPVPVPTPESLEETLTARGAQYGEYKSHALITQILKSDMKVGNNNWYNLSASQKESLEMIAHKIGRILNGNPDYSDSWRDIAGYAMLVADELDEAEAKKTKSTQSTQPF